MGESRAATIRTRSWPRLAAWLTASVALAAPVLSLETTAELGLQSAYLWRGIVVSDRPVLQPAVTVEHGAFSAGLWANIDLTDANGSAHEVSEVDAWAALTVAARRTELTLAVYDYAFPHGDAPSTVEFWAVAAFDTLLSPTVTIVRDVKEVRGWYVLVSASHAVGVLAAGGSDGLAVTVAVGHGDADYRRGYFPDVDASGITDLQLRLDLPFSLGRGTLNLNAQLTSFLEAEIRRQGFESNDSKLSGGLTYSLSF